MKSMERKPGSGVEPEKRIVKSALPGHATIAAMLIVAMGSVGCSGKKEENKGPLAGVLAWLAGSSCNATLVSNTAGPSWPAVDPHVQYVGSISDNTGCNLGMTTLRMEVVHPKSAAANGNSLYTTTRNMLIRTDTTTGAMEQLGASVIQKPFGVAYFDGRIYVADTDLKAVLVLDENGNQLGTIGEGLLAKPIGIAVNESAGLLYVADIMANSIRVFQLSDGALTQTVSGDIVLPSQVAINSTGDIIVLHNGPNKISIFDSTGSLKISFAPAGVKSGTLWRPKGIAVDGDDNIYVTDAAFNNMQVFNDQGKVLTVIGHAGRDPGEFLIPSLVHVDKNNRIYVAEYGSHRVQVFQYLK